MIEVFGVVVAVCGSMMGCCGIKSWNRTMDARARKKKGINWCWPMDKNMVEPLMMCSNDAYFVGPIERDEALTLIWNEPTIRYCR